MQKELVVQIVYPNPVKPEGLGFDLPVDAYVTIEVFNENGTRVKLLFEKKSMEAGKHMIKFNKLDLSAGDYTFRITATIGGENYNVTKQLFLEESI
ncbi:MAG: hypothetical protein HZB59_09645 [Ignavibacteriales bacterium]|nr:hypothetical protein [Ignavibacteriales bacterium]